MEDKPVPTLKEIAYHYALDIISQVFFKDNQFPINGIDYRFEITSKGDVNIIEEEILDNREEFEQLVKSYISNRLNYVIAEGFGYEKKGMVKLYSDSELAKQLEDI